MELVRVADLRTEHAHAGDAGESRQAHDLGVLAVLEIVRLEVVIVLPGVSGGSVHE